MALQSNRQTTPLTNGRMPARNEVEQLTRDDLTTMTPQQIVAAKREGRLRDLLTGADRTTKES